MSRDNRGESPTNARVLGATEDEGPTRRELPPSEVAHRAKERAKRRKARKVAKVHQRRNRR